MIVFRMDDFNRKRERKKCDLWTSSNDEVLLSARYGKMTASWKTD